MQAVAADVWGHCLTDDDEEAAAVGSKAKLMMLRTPALLILPKMGQSAEDHEITARKSGEEDDHALGDEVRDHPVGNGAATQIRGLAPPGLLAHVSRSDNLVAQLKARDEEIGRWYAIRDGDRVTSGRGLRADADVTLGVQDRCARRKSAHAADQLARPDQCPEGFQAHRRRTREISPTGSRRPS